MARHTIRDIASLAGVSIGTVSRVLNQADNVDPTLRQRTLDIIREINYQPSLRGRPTEQTTERPARKKAQPVLSVVFSEMGEAWRANVLWSSYMAGIERACRERDCICMLHFAGEELTAEKVLRARSAGVLLKTPDLAPTYLQELADELPVVLFGGYNPQLPFPQVAIDNHAAGLLAVTRLLELGHRRIVFVNHQPERSMFISRAQGALEALEKAGLAQADSLLQLPVYTPEQHTQPQATPPDMSAVLHEVLNRPQRPTALIFANDWAALGFYHCCAERGLGIPEMFSVVGMDDNLALCGAANPPLSSLALPFEKVAYFAACQLIDMIGGAGQHQRDTASALYIPGEFRARGSISRIANPSV